jgi:hypothetical protein
MVESRDDRGTKSAAGSGVTSVIGGVVLGVGVFGTSVARHRGIDDDVCTAVSTNSRNWSADAWL